MQSAGASSESTPADGFQCPRLLVLGQRWAGNDRRRLRTERCRGRRRGARALLRTTVPRVRPRLRLGRPSGLLPATCRRPSLSIAAPWRLPDGGAARRQDREAYPDAIRDWARDGGSSRYSESRRWCNRSPWTRGSGRGWRCCRMIVKSSSWREGTITNSAPLAVGS